MILPENTDLTPIALAFALTDMEYPGLPLEDREAWDRDAYGECAHENILVLGALHGAGLVFTKDATPDPEGARTERALRVMITALRTVWVDDAAPVYLRQRAVQALEWFASRGIHLADAPREGMLEE